MRLAALDIGTNSVKLAAAEATDGELRVLHQEHEVTRLGEGTRGGLLAEESVERTLAALRRFAERCRELGAERLRAVGTSALRDARNPELLTARSPFPIEILDGPEEARLSYLGATRFARTPTPARTVIDIGGGSTEIATGPDSQASYPLGAGRLTGDYLASDPPTDVEVAAAEAAARRALQAAPARCERPVVLVGSTGSNLAGLAQAEARGLTRPGLDHEAVEGYRVTVEDVRRQKERLRRLTTAERRRLPGLEPDRAPFAVGAAIAAEAVLRHLDLPEVTVSGCGLRFGVLAELASQ